MIMSNTREQVLRRALALARRQLGRAYQRTNVLRRKQGELARRGRKLGEELVAARRAEDHAEKAVARAQRRLDEHRERQMTR